jgi:DNA-binding GntR family transcriptional regulator
MRREDPSSSLTQLAYERLRADVLACRLRPGERLKIQDLCERFAASLGAIREALSRLTSEGLVVATPQRGFSVAPISAEELRDLTMVRLQIEESCLCRSIDRGDLVWESRIVATLHMLSQTPERVAGDPDRLNEDWVRAHTDFHAALVAACDSPWLLKLREQLYAQTERYRRLSVPLARVPRDLRKEHQEIAAAVLARDREQAATLMAQHLNATLNIVVDDAALLGGADRPPPALPSAVERSSTHDAAD